MKDLDLISLRLFVAVCRTGNISRAAEEEHVVPSAISKRMAQLEEDFGVQLLERQRRGVRPSAAGDMLLEHARAILANATRISQDMSGFEGGIRGQVRLLATVSSIAESLPDDVASFMNMPQHRQIHIDIEEAFSRDIGRRIREGSASLGVLWDATQLEGLKSAPYRTDHLAVVTHPSHPLASRKRCSLADTLDYEHVGLQASSAVNVMIDRAAAILGKRIIYRSQVSNFEASMRVVRANLGLSIVPREVAAAYEATFGLRVLLLTDAWAKRRFVICFRDRKALSRPALLLLEHLEREAKLS